MPATDNAARVRLMGFDIDGVLTDGRLYYSPRGDELKSFFVRDGLGLQMLMRAGIEVAIVTGRNSEIVSQRAADLGIRHVRQGVGDKRAVLGELLAALGLDFADAGYMGDDIVDVAVMSACAFSASVADGHRLAHRTADYVARAPAGAGAVREVCELILAAQGKLDAAIGHYVK